MCSVRTWCRSVQVLCILFSLLISYDFAHVCWKSLFICYCPSILALASILVPSSFSFPELWKEGFDGDIPFRAVCANICLTAQRLAVALYIYSLLMQEEAALMMVGQSTGLWVLQNIIRSHCVTTFFNNFLLSFGFALGPCNKEKLQKHHVIFRTWTISFLGLWD